MVVFCPPAVPSRPPKPPQLDQKTREAMNPMTPTTTRMIPATWRSIPEASASTAQARTAPAAIKRMLRLIPIATAPFAVRRLPAPVRPNTRQGRVENAASAGWSVLELVTRGNHAGGVLHADDLQRARDRRLGIEQEHERAGPELS